MDQKGIDRINELARKAKTQELTPEEKKEQHKLRKEFNRKCPHESPFSAG